MTMIESLIRISNFFKAEINKELEKIYPGLNYEDKYILWLENKFYFRYVNNYLKGKVQVFKNNEVEIPLSLRILKPFPNKSYSLISKREGRKALHGIPLIFDTFEELQEIKKIYVEWKLSYDTKSENKNYYEAHMFYNLEFKKDEKSKFYYLSTMDYEYTTLEKDKMKEYFGKFDDFVHIDFYEDRSEWNQYKGELIDESIVENIIMGITLQDIFQNIKIEKGNIVKADILRKKLLLEPVKWEEKNEENI